jgi:DNA polymerase-3 subunit epsilon
MKYVCIDTEGTGLFVHNNADGTVRRSHEPGQPRMAEFAAAIVDESFVVVDTFQQYVLPDETWLHADLTPMLEMPEEAFKANGLSFGFLRDVGRPVRECLEWYSDMIGAGCVPLGFNMQHDGRQMRGELRRAGMPDLFEESPNVCAMRSLRSAGIKIKKLNGKGGYARLIDAAAYFGCPGYDEEKHHRAREDVLATVFVARELHNMGKLLPPAVHRAKNLAEGDVS